MIKLPKIIENGLKIIGKDNIYLPEFGMSFVSVDNQQVSKFETCRDYLHDQIRTFINSKERMKSDYHDYFPKSGNPDMFMDRLRLLIILRPILKDKDNGFHRIRESLRALNTIEKYANVELTIGENIKLIKTNGNKQKLGNSHLILLRGSGEYMKNPHLLSALTLIMRFFYLNDQLIKFRREDDFKRLFNKLEKVKKGKVMTIFNDSFIMKDCNKLLHLIFKERHKLFKDKSINQLFPTDIEQDFHSKGGIYSLCIMNSPNDDVNKRLKKLSLKAGT